MTEQLTKTRRRVSASMSRRGRSRELEADAARRHELAASAMTRRGFLAGSSAAVAAALVACARADAVEQASGNPGKPVAPPAAGPIGRVVDVHQHFWPESYYNLAASLGGAREQWDPVQAIERMDRYGLGTAILSMSNGVSGHKDPSPSQLIRLCRECNDYGAKLVADHPARFGQFGSVMMLPDVDAALKEIEYSFDTLKVDGIGLLTHYG